MKGGTPPVQKTPPPRLSAIFSVIWQSVKADDPRLQVFKYIPPPIFAEFSVMVHELIIMSEAKQ
jgi:hypothetical protein